MSEVSFSLNGQPVAVAADGSLLDALRERLGIRSVKDGCSPQGQCGCCTVWVDGQPRVSCVTPVARVKGRQVTTVEGLADGDAWATQFAARGASQCGFCTPGIIMRLAAQPDTRRDDPAQVAKALLGHLCRCTGWQPIIETAVAFGRDAVPAVSDPDAARHRALLEGGVAQRVGPQVALGRGGFADDTAPDDSLVALRGADGSWVVADTLAEARERSGKVQGRRTTAPLTWPVEVPDGAWARTLQTTWVEPAYLEPDASWCLPGGEPMSSHGNGGAFGAKTDGVAEAAARELADRYQRPVRVLSTREDVVRLGAKRPPLAIGLDDHGRGMVRVAIGADRVRSGDLELPEGVEIECVDVVGPATSMSLRGAVLAEVLAVQASLQPGPAYRVTTPNGAVATAEFDASGSLSVDVRCGRPLDAAVLRSYCIGASHMAMGMVTSEGLSLGDDGVPHDLTIRSFGVLRAVDMPPISVTIDVDDGREAMPASVAVFAAVAAATWSRHRLAPRWPCLG